jgi:hypothetical protein
MSRVFDVPCPDCGQQMLVEAGGGLECGNCQRMYHARMGHLFPVDERPPSRPLAHASSPTTPTPS